MSTAPRLTIDLSALAENWKRLKKLSGSAETSAVIKADAYGIGIEKAVSALTGAGCRTYFVAMVEEGVRIRSVDKSARVFILNGVFADTLDTARSHKLSPVLSTMKQVHLWAEHSGGGESAIHVDTGMNRLGLDSDAAVALAQDQALLEKAGATLLMSHLACADEPAHELNRLQFERFDRLASSFGGMKKSILNSAGIIAGLGNGYDLTRPGISLFGGGAVNDYPNPMKPVVTASARILQIRDARKGETVGYGGTHVLTRDSKFATCSCGYADGFQRALSATGIPLRNGHGNGGIGAIGQYRIPILGRISMDLITFDVTDVPDQVLESNEWVELFGSNIDIDEVARAAGTIGYEILTSMGTRYHREYITT